MGVENDWDHNVEAVEGPGESGGDVVLALKESKTGMAPRSSNVSLPLLAASGVVELCQCQLNGP